jgi:hypothetical protein
MKQILFCLTLIASNFIVAQKTLFYRQRTQLLTNETIGAYPITALESKGITHTQFAYDAKGKLQTISGFKQNVTEYTAENAVKTFYVKHLYVGDTVYQVQVFDLETIKGTDKEIIKKAYDGELTANCFVYKNGKIVYSFNMSSVSYVKNFDTRNVITSEDEDNGAIVEDEEVNEVVEEEEDITMDQPSKETIVVGYEFVYGVKSFDLYFVNINNKRIGIEELHSLKVLEDPIKMTKTIQYFDQDRKRITMSEGPYATEIGFNKEQMVRYTMPLGETGEIINQENMNPKFVEMVDYDKNGYPAKFTRCNKEGKTIEITTRAEVEDPETYEIVYVDEKSYSTMTLVNDGNGNVLESKTFGVDNALQKFGNSFSTVRSTFDADGNTTSTRYYDENNNIVINGANAGEISLFDKENNLIEKTELGVDNLPTANAAGIVTTKYTYMADAVESTSYFDAKGKPMADASGAHKYTLRTEEVQGADDAMYTINDVFDVTGKNIGQEEALGSDMTGEGIMTYNRKVTDTLNRLLSERNFDENHRPLTPYGAQHETRYTYFESSELPGFTDDNINTTKTISFFDVEGKPVLDENQLFHTSQRKIEMTGNKYINTITYLNTDGTLMEREGGAVSIEETSVEPGVYYSYATLDSKNQPIIDSDGIWKSVSEDVDGKNTRSFFDKNNKPTVNALKAHKISTQNEAKLSTISYYNEKGKLVNNKYGYAIEKNVLDENSNVVSQSFYSRKNKPCVSKEYGYHQLKMTYDENFNNVEAGTFNKKLKPIDANCWVWDYSIKAARMIRVYAMSEEGYSEVISQTYYDAKGKEIPSTVIGTDY